MSATNSDASVDWTHNSARSRSSLSRSCFTASTAKRSNSIGCPEVSFLSGSVLRISIPVASIALSASRGMSETGA
jgi:hypothetical protein